MPLIPDNNFIYDCNLEKKNAETWKSKASMKWAKKNKHKKWIKVQLNNFAYLK